MICSRVVSHGNWGVVLPRGDSNRSEKVRGEGGGQTMSAAFPDIPKIRYEGPDSKTRWLSVSITKTRSLKARR